MKYICIWLIRLYQKFISPLKRHPTCRFTPTCSAYAIEAFSKRGFFVGLGLTVWRILRCNPFCAGGYDPVPERRPRRMKNNESDDTANDTNITGEVPRNEGSDAHCGAQDDAHSD
ncbi:MAG: membrane protein insertion efficiency factor YidD [Eubacteriales bacterium]|nr:membrane protein insertion efficiency factor YidD [Eubacteriales bacterium]